MARATSFFTPPRVEPVHLDLAELGGGGSCPTQFWGKTSDGREVYVRYRGGGLSIAVAKAPGDDAARDGDRILDVHLGPVFDGFISLRQFLDLTGLTVPHAIPDVDEDATELDLSGATSFWRATMLPTTDEGALALVEALRKLAPNVVQRLWDDGKTSQVPLPPGARPTSSFLAFHSGNDLPVLKLRYTRFQYDFPGYGRDGDDARLEEQIGTPISVAGSRDCDLKIDSLAASADFSTDSGAARAFLEKVSDVFDAHYPAIDYVSVDPANGKSFGEPVEGRREDPRIADWISGDPHRYRQVRWDRKSNRHVGYRTAALA